jgi:hypothetical protein
MLMLPELAVALRSELQTRLRERRDEAVALSTWGKARASRAEAYVAALSEALARPLEVALWQKGAWGLAIQERERLGGELTTESDVTAHGALWLFDSVGFVMRTGQRESVPFLRLLPELYPGDFLADPHVNFIAAQRYVERFGVDVTPPGDRARGGCILSVPSA